MFRSYVLLFFLLGILSNFVSYSEELILAMLYIVLFIIFSEQTRDTIKKILINKNINMMLIYEQLVYLKEQILIKKFIFLKILWQDKFVKEIKNSLNNDWNSYYVNHQHKKHNKLNVYYYFFFLVNKIYKKKKIKK